MELFLKFKYQLNIIFLVKQFRISIGLYFDRLNILRVFLEVEEIMQNSHS
jgi:hypothetical protein